MVNILCFRLQGTNKFSNCKIFYSFCRLLPTCENPDLLVAKAVPMSKLSELIYFMCALLVAGETTKCGGEMSANFQCFAYENSRIQPWHVLGQQPR